MTVDDDCDAPHRPPEGTPDGFRLDRAVASLYEDLRLTPMLHRLLSHSRRLVDGVAGSISVVDPRTGSYSKLAERGVACRLGQRFSLEDGATGQAFARRRPVVIEDYSALSGGHLPAGHAATHGAATAVPIWWRGEVIGVNVTFAGRRRRFTTDEIDRLEVLTQSAAGALVTAGAGEPSLSRLLRERTGADGDAPALTVVREVGAVAPVPPEVAHAAVELVRSVRGAMAGRHPAAELHVAVVHRPGGLRVLVQAGADEPDRWAAGAAGRDDGARERLAELAGAASVVHVAGWGTSVRADFPYAGTPAGTGGAGGVAGHPTVAVGPSPLTTRETEVLALVARGLGDRDIARALVLSPRTVEKHVGAAIRKTGSTSRTGAAVRAVEQGWVGGTAAAPGAPGSPRSPGEDGGSSPFAAGPRSV